MEYTAYLITAPIAVLALVATYAALRRYGAEPPARSLGRYMLLAIWLLVANILELVSPGEFATVLFAKLEYLALLLLPISFDWFCLRYTGHDRYIRPPARAVLVAASLAMFAVVATNEWHGLFWSRLEFPVVEGFTTLRTSFGPFFWVAAAYTWLLTIVGAFVVLRSYVFERGPYRVRSAAIAAGVLAPGLCNLVYILKLLPSLRKDFTPIGYALGALLFFTGAYLNRSARVIPLARGVVLQELEEGVVFVDPAGRLADYNAFAESLLGLDGSMLGRPAATIAELAPLATLLASASVSADGAAAASATIAERSIVARAKRIGDKREPFGQRGVAITLSDVTERARMQDELDAARGDLLKREHFAVIGRLSADIAHEIHDPLDYVSAQLAAVKSSVAGAIGDEGVRAEVFKALRSVDEGLERIGNVSRSLLEYSKRGAGDEEPAPYDLSRGVQNALELSRSDYARVATVDIDLVETPRVMARGSEIDRVLINILRNAAEAIREKASATGARGRIWVRTRIEGYTVVCEIGNDGTPLADRDGQRVFEEFFSSGSDGKGLGLSISRDVVEKRHGGRLSLASRDPVVFRMELPMAHVSAPSP
ncbi:MAG TPA: histidine kinase N-terminal 7TM domain-containing protein [Spirochaetales bacterium]|nr:histidine kinase N-terminal 7TM domain-containing protein [Spirochaetales bacterium]